MRFLISRSAFLILILLTAPVFHAVAEDWPQFRGLNRDAHSPETGLLTKWPAEGPPLLWAASGLGEGYSAAAIANGTVYLTGKVGDDARGMLFAFDLDGNKRWETHFGKSWDGTHPGTRYPPTIQEGRAYLMSGFGVVTCFNAGTGNIIWQRDIAGDFGGEMPVMSFAESLLVLDDKVICTPGGPDASVVALSTTDGTTVWTSKGLSDQSAYCSSILVKHGGTQLIITLVAATLVALNPDSGAIIWRVPFDETEEMQNHSITPVYSDGNLYVTSGHRKGGKLYSLSDDGTSIKARWTDETLNTLHGGIVIHDGHVYGSTSRGRWVCLSLESGAVRWEDRGPGKGSIAYADGHLYCYGEKGDLALVKATPEAYTEVSRFKVEQGEGNHWAHPAIAGGRLYIRHGDILLAYEISG